MFFIRTVAGLTVTSSNPPTDDIISGLITHWGEAAEIARLKTVADFAAYQAIPYALATIDFEARTVAVSTAPPLTLASDDEPAVFAQPELVATFEIEVIHPASAE